MKFLVFTFVLFLAACFNVDTNNTNNTKSHDHDHGAKQYNSKVINCVGTSGHHVYEEKVVCPLDGEKFTALHLGTHSTMGQHLDWQPISYMRFPVAIPVCPKNGFIIDQEKYTDEELAKRKKYIESPEYQTLYKENHSTFYLFAKQSEALQENLDSLYWYYLKATWEADGCGNHERYNQYANLVIEKATENKSKISETEVEFTALSILIAEMYRRTGRFTQAQEHLNKIDIPPFENPKTGPFYLLTKKILQQAIDEKSIERVAIREPANNKPQTTKI